MQMLKYMAQRARWLAGAVTRYFGALFLLILSGLVLGTLAFTMVLNSAYGILPANLLFSKKATDAKASLAIALLHSNYSATAYEKMRANHRVQVGVWSNVLKEAGFNVQLIEDADLERGLDRTFQALILPGSLALSDRELGEVRRFVRAGGGLLIEGPAGTRDGGDGWRGWNFIKDLTASDAVEVLKSQGQTRRFVAVAHGHPFGVQLPNGAKMENGFYGENYAVAAEAPAAYWSEWVRPAALASPNLAAITSHQYGSGRVVWFGFGLGAMSEQTEAHQMLLRLLTNTVAWITQQPLAEVATWPHAEQGAVSVTFDCEENFTNLTKLFDLPEAQPYPFTFFMLSSIAQKHPDLVKKAASRGEIAIHGDDHTPFSDQPADTQVQRLLRARSLLQTLSKQSVESFRPPEQKYDAVTLWAMRKVGLKNLFADYLGSAAPRLDYDAIRSENFRLPFLKSDSTLIKMPRPYYDDYDLFVRNSLDGSQAGVLMVSDLDQVLRDGGLYISSMHTTAPWGGLNGDKMAALTALLRALPGRSLWVTTIKDAADWWNRRSQIQVTVTKYSDTVILLQVTNSSRQSLAELPVEVYLPPNYTKVDLQSSKVEFQRPRWTMAGHDKVVVYIPSIRAGESKSYILTNRENAP